MSTSKTTSKTNSPLRVMLVDDDPKRASLLEENLITAGYDVLSIISSTSAILFQIEQHRPDVVLIDLKFPGRDVLESLAVVNDHNPTPMLMFTEEGDTEYIHQAFNAGVSTYMMEGINPKSVKPLIDLALAQFQSFQKIKEELSATKNELEDQRLVMKAKTLLMKHRKTDEDGAHKMLSKMSMDHNLKIPEVAKMVITTISDIENKDNKENS